MSVVKDEGQNKKTKKNAANECAVYTSYSGTNADLVSSIERLYLKPNMVIADVTWGMGAFWRKTDLSKYRFYKSDLVTCPEAAYDFRHLPYEDSFFDVVVIDPPYAHNPGSMFCESRYQNKATTSGLYHKDVIELYRQGMIEAKRILKQSGQLWVKCKDEIESSKQKWSHIEIFDIAIRELGFSGKDKFVLTPSTPPIIQHFPQQHARKNHSYLWIFQKSKH